MDDLPPIPPWHRAAFYAALCLLVGCSHHPTKEQSWDQENLKKNDIADCRLGNPVFVAPNGNLEQCE